MAFPPFFLFLTVISNSTLTKRINHSLGLFKRPIINRNNPVYLTSAFGKPPYKTFSKSHLMLTGYL